MSTTSPKVLLVFPKFSPNSFWNLQAVCDVWGARCPAPPLGLITLAALLLPSSWNLRLVNRNAEELTDADLAWADLVMTGGMLPQYNDAQVIIEMCKTRGKPVVVGAPMPCRDPMSTVTRTFSSSAKPKGLSTSSSQPGLRAPRPACSKARSSRPTSPRARRRVSTCSISSTISTSACSSLGAARSTVCDIIELYGRVPRAKTTEQMLTEIDTLYRLGHRGHVDFVDDNLIGNKKALKRFLPALIAWQKEHSYPFRFSTEASMNLADDTELLRMLREANFFLIFVGIESPDTSTLISMQKKQNTRRSLADSVHRIYQAGMVVIAGFIVGFDNETASVAEGMADCIEATSIPVCMVGLLTALPNTQLTRRLEKEGRVLPVTPSDGDQCTGGLNFITLRERRDVLADFRAVLKTIYDPVAYFERVRTVGRMLDRPVLPHLFSASNAWHDVKAFARLIRCMTFRRTDLRPHFWRTVIDCLRNKPRNIETVLGNCAFYLHLGSFAQFLIADLDRKIEALDDEATRQPQLRKVAQTA